MENGALLNISDPFYIGNFNCHDVSIYESARNSGTSEGLAGTAAAIIKKRSCPKCDALIVRCPGKNCGRYLNVVYGCNEVRCCAKGELCGTNNMASDPDVFGGVRPCPKHCDHNGVGCGMVFYILDKVKPWAVEEALYMMGASNVNLSEKMLKKVLRDVHGSDTYLGAHARPVGCNRNFHEVIRSSMKRRIGHYSWLLRATTSASQMSNSPPQRRRKLPVQGSTVKNLKLKLPNQNRSRKKKSTSRMNIFIIAHHVSRVLRRTYSMYYIHTLVSQ